MRKNVVIFASGSGTNAENIIRHFKGNDLINISLVISNKKEAPVLMRAKRLGLPTAVFASEDWQTGVNVLTLLNNHQIDFIVLAGFLIRVPESLLHAYPHHIINIHPALLPNYGGKGMYGDRVHRAVVAARETQSGITIHYINEHYDEGDIIFQASCEVLPTDSPDDLAQKVHALEYQFYPAIIEEVLLNQSTSI